MRALSLLVLFVLAACAGTGSPSAPAASAPAASGGTGSPSAPAASAPAASAAPTASAAQPSPPAAADLNALDVCSVLSAADVQTITGETVGFAQTSGSSHAHEATCFWGDVRVPAYVEIRVYRSKDGLSRWNPSASCAATVLSGIGDEAKGAICAPNPQQKVWLAVADEGLVVTVLVNEPQRPLAPEDLAETFLAVSERLR